MCVRACVFIDNFVYGIGNILVKFHQEALSIIQNQGARERPEGKYIEVQ